MILKNVARMGLVLSMFAAVACQGDGATAPTAPATSSDVPPVRLEVVHPAVTASVLTRSTPLDSDYTVSKTIGPFGGTFTVPGGLLVVVPPFAVSRSTTFTATALQGNIVAYEFGPHGTTFNVPLLMTQDLRGTSAEGQVGVMPTEVGYFADRTKLDYEQGRATVKEFLPISLSVSPTGQTLTYNVKHFSGYVIVTGRQ